MIQRALREFFTRHNTALRPGSRLLVACSGGPDSVALINVLRNLEGELPYSFEIAHVNHALRGKASQGDARFVRGMARGLSWPFHMAVRPIRTSESGNLEEKAREARYEALRSIAAKRRCAAILTAHHEDDQVETVFLNLLRGSGPDGMGGMKESRMDLQGPVPIMRPLLTVPRSEIIAHLRKGGISYRRDRSNRNTRFLRNWLRLKVFPLLETRSPGFKSRVGSMARLVRDEKQYWTDYVGKLERRLLRRSRRGHLLDFRGLLRYSSAVQRRFLRHLVGQNLLTYDAVERLRNWMAGPPTSGRIWQLRKGWIVERLSKSHGSPTPTFFWLGQLHERRGNLKFGQGKRKK